MLTFPKQSLVVELFQYWLPEVNTVVTINFFSFHSISIGHSVRGKFVALEIFSILRKLLCPRRDTIPLPLRCEIIYTAFLLTYWYLRNKYKMTVIFIKLYFSIYFHLKQPTFSPVCSRNSKAFFFHFSASYCIKKILKYLFEMKIYNYFRNSAEWCSSSRPHTWWSTKSKVWHSIQQVEYVWSS